MEKKNKMFRERETDRKRGIFWEREREKKEQIFRDRMVLIHMLKDSKYQMRY